MVLCQEKTNHHDSLLDEVLAQYLTALEQGQAPSREALLAAHPEWASELVDFFANGDHVEHLASPLRACAASATALAAGTMIGDYEVLDEIAHGGMGIVYRARQNSLQRLVALKILSAGPLASPEQWQRFQAEAESIASLDHPHIVPVYEVGVCDRMPYFSMKLLEGGSLAQRLRSGARPTLREAAQLVATIADAVHYAHERGILHRDLKPANVLLDAQGQPHVSDFGLAKRAAGANGTAIITKALTLSGVIVGTPSYMAPEQAAGSRGLTTAVDVYGLGAILYELLTGRPPLVGTDVLDTLRRLREEEPQNPRTLNPQVERDLETICLKCLRKEPAQRYASARELALDLRRYLAGELIEARPVGRVERLLRWCRRRPFAAAGILAFVTAIMIAFVLVDRARQEAEERRLKLATNQRETRQVLDDFTQELSKESWSDDPLIAGQRKTLLEKSLAYYQHFLDDPQAEAPAREELVTAYVRLGEIAVALAKPDKAMEALGRALATAETLRQLHPDDVRARLWLGRIHNRIGVLHKDAKRSTDALQEFRASYDLLQELHRQAPEEINVMGELSSVTNNLGSLHLQLGRREEALTNYRECVAMNRELCTSSTDSQYPYALAISLGNLSAVLFERGQRSDSWKPAEEANKLLHEVVRKEPDVPRYQKGLALNLHNRGIHLCKDNRPGEAIAPLIEGRDVLTRLVEMQPRSWWYQVDLAQLLQQLGHGHRDYGDRLGKDPSARDHYAKALEAYQTARQVNEKLTAVQSNPAEARFRMACCTLDIGITQSKRGAIEEMMQAYRQTAAECRRLLKQAPDHLDYHALLGLSLNNLGRELSQLKRYPESLEALREALEHTQLVHQRAPRHGFYRTLLNTTYVWLGAVYRDTGRPDDWTGALLERRKLWPDNSGELYGIACDLAWAKADEEAMKTLRLAIQKGFKDRTKMAKEPALTKLRQRTDFAKLLP